MKMIQPVSLAIAPVLLLAGCASLPTGPSVLILPGIGKSFEQFRADDMQCRHYALAQCGGATPGQVATGSGVGTAAAGTAAAGTAVGAAAGVALGGSEGAAIGAGTGLLAGTISGAESARATGYEAQQRYDMSYIQCMYAFGNRVPVNGNFVDEAPYTPQPSGSPTLYPPPPGTQAPALPPR